jgi:hypothetical protein
MIGYDDSFGGRYEKLSEHVQKAVLLKIRGYC